jgi:hypothetical protein
MAKIVGFSRGRDMKNLLRPAINGDSRKSTIAAIMLSVLLAVAITLAFSNNVIGVLVLLGAPFWLPLCCYRVRLHIVKIFLGISLFCLLITFPLTLLKDFLVQPNRFVFAFGLTSVMLTIGLTLGLLVAYSRQQKTPPADR